MNDLQPSSPDSPTFDLAAVKTIHLMAIAGTGMGAFARLLQQAGYEVRGSDEKVWPPMSDLLREAGIEWKEGFSAENLEPAPDLVVVGNVIRRVNPEAEAMREKKLAHLSFPEALGALFLQKRRSLVVAGTHGKTTTTSLLAWMLHEAGKDPSFLVGGVAQNLGDSARLGGGEHFVIEGDEYDTAYFDKGPKFLHYRPEAVIFTSLEFDHADIFRDLGHYRAAFADLMKLVPPTGVVAACANDPELVELALTAPGRVATYTAREEVDALWRAERVRTEEGRTRFEVRRAGRLMGELLLPLTGLHNVENTLAALVVGDHLGLYFEEMRPGLESFAGVRRRQEVRGEPGGVTVVDDFAHHPTAVRETVAALRAAHPERRLWAIFEPRSNTARRNIYQEAYAGAFEGADQILVASPPPHPDPIPADEAFDPAALVAALEAQEKSARHLPDPDAILEALKGAVKEGDVVLIMSNGAFGDLPGRLVEALEG